MANYNITISESARKRLLKVLKKDIPKIVSAINGLAENPFPSGIRKLNGEENVYRHRVGNYRIIYEVKKKQLIILVLKVGHRKDVYRNL